MEDRGREMREARAAMRAAGMEATNLMMHLFSIREYVYDPETGTRGRVYPFLVEEYTMPSRRKAMRRMMYFQASSPDPGNPRVEEARRMQQAKATVQVLEDSLETMENRLERYRTNTVEIPDTPAGRAVRMLLIASQNEEREKILPVLDEAVAYYRSLQDRW